MYGRSGEVVDLHDSSDAPSVRAYDYLSKHADRLNDPVLRGAAQLAVTVPFIGYLIARETVADIQQSVAKRIN